MTCLADGREVLEGIIKSLDEAREVKRNEAQTRLDILDRLIIDCFGWKREAATCVRVEVHERGEYTDYELGEPRCVIWEAKREGDYFDLPPGAAR